MKKLVEILDFAKNNCNQQVAGILNKVASMTNNGLHILMDGPEPFIKYMCLKAPSGMLMSLAPVRGNEDLIRTHYAMRSNEAAEELPYLERYILASDLPSQMAEGLTVVLYSAEQLLTEGIEIDAQYGLVTVLVEPVEDRISPMSPDTILRNGMGAKFGGNGTAVDRKLYRESVKFWEQWVLLKDTLPN